MDQLSAHLDRGWDLVQKGDLRGARAAARRALAEDKDSPEAHNLLGYVAAQEGEADEALEHYRSAMALDDGYLDPMLNAAELLIFPMGEYEEAIALCDEVLELVEAPEETADALLLKFDALLAKGDREAARAVLNGLPDEPLEGDMYPFFLGRAWWEAGEHAKAGPLLEDAVKREPTNPDAWYYCGMAADHAGDWRRAAQCFLLARELDLRAPAPPWSLSKQGFEETLHKALKRLDETDARDLSEALFVVSDAPGVEVVAEGVDPRIPLYFDGIAGPGDEGALVFRVFVYQRACEREAGSVELLEDLLLEELREELKEAREQQKAPEEGAAPVALSPRGGSARAQRAPERDPETEALEDAWRRRPPRSKSN